MVYKLCKLNKYECTKDQELTDAAGASCALTRWQHFSAWNNVMAAILNYDVMSKIRPRQSMCIYLQNNPAKFHPNPIWNDGALSPVHTGDYARRLRRLSPNSATNCRRFSRRIRRRQCGQGFMLVWRCHPQEEQQQQEQHDEKRYEISSWSKNLFGALVSACLWCDKTCLCLSHSESSLCRDNDFKLIWNMNFIGLRTSECLLESPDTGRHAKH